MACILNNCLHITHDHYCINNFVFTSIKYIVHIYFAGFLSIEPIYENPWLGTVRVHRGQTSCDIIIYSQ